MYFKTLKNIETYFALRNIIFQNPVLYFIAFPPFGPFLLDQQTIISKIFNLKNLADILNKNFAEN